MKKWKSKYAAKETTASTAKIAFWYVISNAFANGMMAISTPVFTRLMSKGEYGQFNNFTSWESIITVLVTLNLSSSIARAKYEFDEKMDEYISSILIFSNLVTLGALFLIESRQSFFVSLFSMDILYIRMMFIYLLFLPAFTYLQIKHRIYRKYKFVTAFSIVSAMIRMVLSVFLVLLFDDKLLGGICGYLFPVTLMNVILWIIVIVNGKKVLWHCIKYACRISIPLIPHTLSGIILRNSDRIMITNYCGSEATALYSVAYTISSLVSLLWTSMNQAWSPWLYDNMNVKNKKTIVENSKIYLGVFTVMIIGVLLITPEILFLFGGNQYYSARYVMPPIIVGLAFQFVYAMYVNIEIFMKRTMTISIGTMVAAVLNLYLNWLFIPRYGYIAAAYTTMAGYFVLMLVHYYIVKLTVKEYADIYDNKFIFKIAVLFIVSGGLSLFLYQYHIIRYILLLFYAIVILAGLYKYRMSIKQLFK